MNSFSNKKGLLYGIFLSLCFVLSSYAQVVFTSNLNGVTHEICAGSYKKIGVTVSKGTCNDFAGNVNSVAFTWQIESSPGVWQDVNSYSISGITYSTSQTINGSGTAITNNLSVKSTKATAEMTLKYRVLAQGSGGCPVATSASESVLVKSNKWTGAVSSAWTDVANWSCNFVPTVGVNAIIAPGTNPALISSTVEIKDLIVETGGVLTVASGYNLTVNGSVTVQGTGNFTLQNNANLIQGSYIGANTGNITVGRNSSALMRLDYTLWSSPVTSQNLLAFSPLTQTSRFYVYNSATNAYSSIAPGSNSFQVGKGYLIRMPDNHPTTPTVWNGVFTGVPNNGNITVPLYNGGAGLRFSAIGNPYPSPVKLNSFVSTNTTKITGTLYFWRKSNNTATNPGYCTWTTAGFVSNGEAQVFNPNGILRTGQGFLVEAVNTQTSVVFNNTMRIANNEDQFFRQTGNEEETALLSGDKIKLNIRNSDGLNNQLLIGYFENATNGVDYAIDGKSLDTYPISLTATIDDVEYAIEGRPSFVDSDKVKLKFKSETAGEFVITTDELSGVFASDQAIYLKDKMAGKIHDLKRLEYRFVTEAGVFKDRFELMYKNNSSEITELSSNTLLVYKNNGMLTVKSEINISAVKVYDIRGRLLSEANGIAAPETTLRLDEFKGVLVVQVTTDDGQVSIKKIVY